MDDETSQLPLFPWHFARADEGHAPCGCPQDAMAAYQGCFVADLRIN